MQLSMRKLFEVYLLITLPKLLSYKEMVDVLESVYTAADNKEITVLIGFDLSAAFDTVCHSTLTQFGVSGTAISWIQSYIARSDAVR